MIDLKTNIKLTDCQEKAMKEIGDFLKNKNNIFMLKGGAGTGKLQINRTGRY